jgi:hypothetical protein
LQAEELNTIVGNAFRMAYVAQLQRQPMLQDVINSKSNTHFRKDKHQQENRTAVWVSPDNRFYYFPALRNFPATSSADFPNVLGLLNLHQNPARQPLMIQSAIRHQEKVPFLL